MLLIMILLMRSVKSKRIGVRKLEFLVSYVEGSGFYPFEMMVIGS